MTGENGSGKSTLLSVIAGVLAPDEGSVRVDGVSLLDHPKLRGQKIGYVPQECALLEELTAGENLRLWQSAYGISPSADFRRSPLYGLLGLEELERLRLSKMSGGMKKRVSIAVGLMNEPAYLADGRGIFCFG